MREMSASEASRNFSAVLDSAEHGETVVVTRSGRRVALIASAREPTAPQLRDVVVRWRNTAPFDDTIVQHVADARNAASADLDDDPWNE